MLESFNKAAPSLLPLVAITAMACARHDGFRKNYRDVNSIIHDSANVGHLPFLKAHTKSGEVFIFDEGWAVDTVLENISGWGEIFDFHRKSKGSGQISLPLDSIAIFETNSKIKTSGRNARFAALGILTALDIALGLYCVTVPKACWGSCPTFYLKDDGRLFSAAAEGFSNAISPSLERSDIDALNNDRIEGRSFSLTMKNEALETHVVKEVKILAYPRNENEQVFHGVNDEFYLASRETAELLVAWCPEGDCREKLVELDGNERFGPADANGLSSKEEIHFEFNVTGIGNEGLVLNFRQTLMTTYLIYSALGYMGDEVGDFFASIEINPDIEEQLLGIQKELGGIEVYVWENAEWNLRGTFFEHGPVAKNLQILPLMCGDSADVLRVKLRLNRGLWRIDFAAIAEIKGQVSPIELHPTSVAYQNRENQEALHSLLDASGFLISMPGDRHDISFELPSDKQDYGLFLLSKGYYIEWMRKRWLKEKNPLKLARMISSPRQYLQDEAKEYKRYEIESEREFWNSRIDPSLYTYHE